MIQLSLSVVAWICVVVLQFVIHYAYCLRYKQQIIDSIGDETCPMIALHHHNIVVSMAEPLIDPENEINDIRVLICANSLISSKDILKPNLLELNDHEGILHPSILRLLLDQTGSEMIRVRSNFS